MTNNHKNKYIELFKKTHGVAEWATVRLNKLKERLAPWAIKDRYYNKKEYCKKDKYDHRTKFQHDISRIIHSKAFRRLKHKTQVFISYEKDHYRTRLTHVMEVFQLATNIARTLGLDEDLAGAIALGHDLGHTPFGHAGESSLNNIMEGKCEELLTFFNSEDKEEIIRTLELRKHKLGFGFQHNFQSIKVLKNEERDITPETREGILKHTNWLKFIRNSCTNNKLYASNNPEYYLKDVSLDLVSHLEGQVVAICDEIAQRCHDLDDGIRSNLICIDNKDFKNLVNKLKRNAKISHASYVKRFTGAYSDSLKRKDNDPAEYLPDFIDSLFHLLVSNLLERSIKSIKKAINTNKHINSASFTKKIGYSEIDSITVKHDEHVHEFQKELKEILKIKIYHSSPSIVREERAKYFILNLFKAYLKNPLSLPDKTLLTYFKKNNLPNKKTKSKLFELRKMTTNKAEIESVKYRKDVRFWETICDHISGMTDDYAQDRFERFYAPFKMVTKD